MEPSQDQHTEPMQLKRAAAVKCFRIVSLVGVGISSVADFLYLKLPDQSPRAVSILLTCTIICLFLAFLTFWHADYSKRPSEQRLMISAAVLFAIGILLVSLFIIVNLFERP